MQKSGKKVIKKELYFYLYPVLYIIILWTEKMLEIFVL